MRRTKPEKRSIEPDVRFNNLNIQVIIHHVLKKGKKSTATRIVYDAMDIIEDKLKKNPIEVLELALKNVGPVMEVRPRRLTLAIRWLMSATRSRSGRSFAEKLAAELMEAAENQGSAIRKKEETHKMAEANRAFSHFRF
jgi:small subunit ribosomal protein S7